MTRTVQMPDLADQLAEIVADPTAYVRRTREMHRRLVHMTTPVLPQIPRATEPVR